MLCVDNAFVGDDPDIEPVVGEFGEREDQDREQVCDKRCDDRWAPEHTLYEIGIDGVHDEANDDGKKEENEAKDERSDKFDPMSTKKEDDFLVWEAVWELVEVHHRPKGVVLDGPKGIMSLMVTVCFQLIVVRVIAPRKKRIE